MKLSAESGMTGPMSADSPAAVRYFWARPSFGAEPIPARPIQLILRWLLVATFVVFVAAGETRGATPWHLAIAGVALGLNVPLVTLLLMKARSSPERLMGVWALVLPADVATISVVASIDHNYPSIIPTIALATVFNASVMFRTRDVLVIGIMAAAGTLAVPVPRRGLEGVGLETVMQALITLGVTGFAIARGLGEEGLRHTLIAAQGRVREQNEVLENRQAQLKLAMAAGRIGTWELDMEPGGGAPWPAVDNFGERVCESLALALGVHFNAVHPDDRAKVAEAAQRTVADGEPLDTECRFVAGPADEVHWLRVAGDAIRDERGQPTRIVGVVMDVTHLVTAQRLEAVGRLAGGIAHDFNNTLTAIIGFNALAAGALGEGHQASQDIEDSTAAAKKAAELVHQLLAFARREVVEPRDVDLNELLANMERLLRRLIREDVELRFVPSPVPLVCMVDPGQFEQVLVNLAVNARDAMALGGALTIAARPLTLDAAYAATHQEVAPGEYALVEVTDNGTGIQADVLDHIFEPFFTTKDQGKGTGLGLASCFGIVNQAGGHMAVHTELGNGTTFQIYLPLAVSSVAALAVGSPANDRE